MAATAQSLVAVRSRRYRYGFQAGRSGRVAWRTRSFARGSGSVSESSGESGDSLACVQFAHALPSVRAPQPTRSASGGFPASSRRSARRRRGAFWVALQAPSRRGVHALVGPWLLE